MHDTDDRSPGFPQSTGSFCNNASPSDHAGPEELQKSSSTVAAGRQIAVSAVLCLGIVACSPAADSPGEVTAPAPPASAGCDAQGSFRARLYGEITADLSWASPQYECRGMPRPDGRGARLFFAGHDTAGDQRLAFILAIPAFDRDAASRELGSSLTVIEEGSGRFFSTATEMNCLTDITAIEAPDPESSRVSVHGAVFCVSPLAEVNGDSSVSIAELQFSGMLDWEES